MTALGGHKSLYSTVHYPAEEFWQRYNGTAYARGQARLRPGRAAARPVRQVCAAEPEGVTVGRAEAFERVIGGGTGQVAVRAFDGSRAGPADAPVTHRDPLAAGAVLPGHRAAASSAWPGPTSPATWRSTATCYTALAHLSRLRPRACRCGERLRLLRELGGVRLLRAAAAAAAGGAAARPAALQGPRPARRSRTTTTCPTGSTSGCSARRWPTPARSTRPRRPRLEEAQFAKHDLVARKLGAASRACGCSTSAAAGAAWSCTRPGSTACGRSA